MFAAILFASALLSGSVSGQSSNTAAPSYEIFLWRLDERQMTPAFARALRALGVDGVNVAGTAESAPVARLGLPFYVDHVAGKGPLFLSEKKWDAVLQVWLAQRSKNTTDSAGKDPEGDDPAARPKRPDCLSEPEVKARAVKRIDEVLSKALQHRPVALSLDDEISLSRRNKPFDFCFGESTLALFREQVAEDYGSIENLNAHWKTDFESFASLRPLTTDEIRKRELHRDVRHWNLAPWSDFRLFMDQHLAEVVHELAARVRKRAPKIPVGFTGGEAPSPFSGVDWPSILKGVDFVEPYDVAGTRELVRSFATPNTRVFKTLFLEETAAPIAGQTLWSGLLRGDSGLIVWSSRSFFAAPDSLKPSRHALAYARLFRELHGPAARAWMASIPSKPRIGLLECSASNRLHWMLDSRDDGGRWWRRFGSYEAANSSQHRTREAWQKLLEDLGLDYRHVSPEQIIRDRGRELDAVILPRTIAMSDALIEALKEFGNSKLVIADAQTALFDQTLRARERGGLDEAFGLKEQSALVDLEENRFRGLRDPKKPGLLLASRTIRVDRSVLRGLEIRGRPVLIEKRLEEGAGRFVFLNLLLVDYLKDRREAGGRNLRNHLRRILRSADLRPRIDLRVEGPPVRLFCAEDAAGELVALAPNVWTSTEGKKKPEPPTKPSRVTLRFDRPRRLTALPLVLGTTQKPATPPPSARRRWIVEIDPTRPSLFRVE